MGRSSRQLASEPQANEQEDGSDTAIQNEADSDSSSSFEAADDAGYESVLPPKWQKTTAKTADVASGGWETITSESESEYVHGGGSSCMSLDAGDGAGDDCMSLASGNDDSGFDEPLRSSTSRRQPPTRRPPRRPPRRP